MLKKRQNQKSTPAADGAGNADVDADDIEAMMEEDEDPIFELLLVIASFYLHKHRTHHAERLRLRIPLETDTSVSLLLDTEENDFNGANESNNSNISGSSISLLPSTDLLRAEALLRVVLEQREANFGAVHEKTFEAVLPLPSGPKEGEDYTNADQLQDIASLGAAMEQLTQALNANGV